MTSAQTFDEDRIRFEFDPNTWFALKWDDSAEFTGPTGIRKLNGELTDTQENIKISQGTRGVDFLGLHADSLYLFEVKDFRGYAAANAYRQEHELPLEIGLKVRDTLAGLVGANHVHPTPWAKQAIEILADRERPITVIAWIVEDPVHSSRERRVAKKTALVRSHQLQTRLSWLTRRAWVDDPLNPSVPLPGIHAHTIRTL
jgi:hypothetical protein